MKISETARFPATPEEVFAILADKDFQEAKCLATAAVSHSVEVTAVDGRTRVRTRRELPAKGLPDVARSFVGDTLTVTETHDWGPAQADGSRHGTLEMEVKGAPMTMRGTVSLTPDGEGTLETIDSDLTASIPLLGGKIEKAAAPIVQQAITIETRLAHERLGG